MFYIQKLINKDCGWEYYTAHRYGSWAHFIVFAKGYNTREEAENKLEELGLEGKVRIIEKNAARNSNKNKESRTERRLCSIGINKARY